MCAASIAANTRHTTTSHSNWLDAPAPRTSRTGWFVGVKLARASTHSACHWHFGFGGSCGLGAFRRLRDGAIVHQEPAIFVSFVERHIDNLESHILGAIVAHHSGDLKVAQTGLQAQLHLCPRRQMTTNGG